jgi:cell division protease FtsH
VVLDRPDVKGREAILKVHTRGKPLGSDIDLKVLARSTAGFVGADLENMVNEAAILAARKNKKSVSMREMEEAIYRVMLGPERKSRVISEDQKRLVAYHEAGHAIVAHFLPYCEPVRKLTIIPRGMTGGVTVLDGPEDDTMIETRAKIKDMIAMALGGRAAEEIVFGDITTGAGGGNGSDLERVTRYARAMVQRYGMSERLGPMMFGQKEEMIFLGREISEQRDYSESVAEIIDQEVKVIVDEAYERAKQILIEQRPKLEAIATRVIETETIDYDEFLSMMGDGVKKVKKLEMKGLPAPRESAQKGSQSGNELPPLSGALPNPV